MADVTDLCNDALGQIGATRITAIDDNSHNANVCSTFYSTLRDGFLSLTRWSFAETRIELAQVPIPPLFGFTYSYQLPTDLLVIREFNGNNANPTIPLIFGDAWFGVAYGVNYFKIEGDKLFTNDSSAFIVYTARIENPDRWGALFYQALTFLLAAKLASALTKDDKKAQAKLQDGLNMIHMASGVDGQQGSVVPMPVNDLIWGRFNA